MSVWLAIALLVAVVNPPRRRAELANDTPVIAAGAALTLGAVLLLGWWGDGLIDALDISAPTLRVGVGLVLAVRGLIDLVRPLPGPGECLHGMGGAVVPVFFPVLFRPELALVAVSVSVDAGLGALTVAAAIGLGLVAVPTAQRWARPLNVVAATGLLVLAVDRLIDGVFAL